MNKYIIIGDLHGDYHAYRQILESYNPESYAIQIGDYGVGFHPVTDEEFLRVQKTYPRSFFFLGNHDNIEIVKNYPGFLGKYGFIPESQNKIGFISGACSSDKQYRTPGLNWWPTEELSLIEMNDCFNYFKNQTRPKIMLSHDCPEFLLHYLYPSQSKNENKTNLFLNKIYELLKPSLWIFGHHHVDKIIVYDNTVFRCLNIKSREVITI